MLIEDNVDARQALRALLELDGHEVQEASDGHAGLAAALRWQPEFAFIDIGLPGLDGYAVAAGIKAANETIRLIALTGYGRDDDKRRARAAGFHAHLLKPVNPDIAAGDHGPDVGRDTGARSQRRVGCLAYVAAVT